MAVFRNKEAGTWHYAFMYQRKRYRKVIMQARTRREAQAFEASVKLAVYNGTYSQSQTTESRPTFAEFVASDFLPYSKANKRTFYDDCLITRTLNNYFGEIYLDGITAKQVEAYKQERLRGITRKGTTRSPATVNRELCVLSKIFSLAFDAEMINANPCLRVRKLRQPSGRIRYLSVDEHNRLYEAIAADKLLFVIVTLALNTGMRRGEILKLRWEQVDFVRGILNIQNTKSGKDRVLPMNADVKNVLLSIPRTSEYVLLNEQTGKPFVDLKERWTRARERAGIKDFRFHDLRHTAGTRLAEAGADAFVIAEILGHSDLKMTKRYVHATDEAKRRAVDKLVSFNVTCRSNAALERDTDI